MYSVIPVHTHTHKHKGHIHTFSPPPHTHMYLALAVLCVQEREDSLQAGRMCWTGFHKPGEQPHQSFPNLLYASTFLLKSATRVGVHLSDTACLWYRHSLDEPTAQQCIITTNSLKSRGPCYEYHYPRQVPACQATPLKHLIHCTYTSYTARSMPA